MPNHFPRAAIYKTGKGNLAPLVILIVLCASVLRFWSAGGDLWVDEVWSLDQMRIALASDEPRDVAALFFHANTHALNTFYLAIVHTVMGSDASDYSYRLLSVISGIASVLLAARIGARWSNMGGIIAALLIATSYPMIHYAGEARGYSPMIFAALGCYYILLRYLEEPTVTRVIGFIAFSMIGLMSHLTFVVMQAGLGLWALVVIYSNRRSIISTLARLIPLFGIQFIALVAYGSIAVGNMVRGGDCCPEPAFDSIRIMAGLTVGFDAIAYPTEIPLIAIAIVSVLALLWLSLRRDKSWVMLGVVIILFPLVIWFIETKPDVIHRYFLLSALLLLILLARVLESLWQQKGFPRIIASVLICVYLVGNASLLMQYKDGGGRGQYRAALTHILKQTPSPQRISVWPNFSVSMVLNHHIRQMNIGDKIRIVAKENESANPTDWYIDGYLFNRAPKQEIIHTINGYGEARYVFKKTFGHWGLSGDTYALYKLVR